MLRTNRTVQDIETAWELRVLEDEVYAATTPDGQVMVAGTDQLVVAHVVRTHNAMLGLKMERPETGTVKEVVDALYRLLRQVNRGTMKPETIAYLRGEIWPLLSDRQQWALMMMDGDKSGLAAGFAARANGRK